VKYTLGKAALATGKSKTTLHRAITSGKLSASRNEGGAYEIDPAELMRVYEIVTPEPQRRHDMERSGTGDDTRVLRTEIEGLKQQLALLKDERDDLRRRLDEASVERRRLTLLLTEAPAMSAPKSSFWKRLFSG
jgi:chromosome segregation ATPase